MSRIIIALLSWVGFTFGVLPQAIADHTASASASEDRLILGWLETIVLKPWDVVLRAKLDTGANTSSIDAEDIIFFEKDQQKWVRFTIVKNKRNDQPDHRIEIERPLVRSVLIREHFWESQRRPVVTLPFCLNGTRFETEFNLVNRSNFKYPVLLGRLFLQKVALVDPDATSLTHTLLRDCKEQDFTIEAKKTDSAIQPTQPDSSESVLKVETEIEKLPNEEMVEQSSEILADKEVSEVLAKNLEPKHAIDVILEKAKKSSEIIEVVQVEQSPNRMNRWDSSDTEVANQDSSNSFPDGKTEKLEPLGKTDLEDDPPTTGYSENSAELDIADPQTLKAESQEITESSIEASKSITISTGEG